ncbi:MAG TPA: chemotaxis protein CheB [Drouetiella sp.]
MTRKDIVVIGASAGGIEAIHNLLRSLPDDLPASFFVVVHLSPQTPSYLARVLSRGTRLKVISPADETAIEHGVVYVAPANRHLLVKPGIIRLGSGPRENRSRPSVDALFRTASFAYHDRVIGIILSGALSDGTAGLLTIKHHGGTAIVQDPEEASFSGMPRSALDFVDVDHVLTVSDIAKKVIELTKNGNTPSENKPVVDPNAENGSVYEHGTAGLRDGMAGDHVPLTCPSCGGALWQTDIGGGFKEFKCHVGHSFTADTLLQEQADAIDAQFWKNLRQLEENIWFRRKLAEWARKTNNEQEAQIQEDLAQVAERQAAHIRHALLTDVNKLDSPFEL